ncbi:MAG: WG repeat-containing protein [Pirellulaceae bacterium]
MKKLYPFCKNSLWGYIDQFGKEVIPPTFTSARPFRGGLARVMIEHSKNVHGIEAFINVDGVVEIGPGPPETGYARYEIWKEHINHGASPEWAYGDFASKRALFRDLTMRKGVGYIDDNGRLVAMGFSDGYDFSDDAAIVFLGSRHRVPAIIDVHGTELSRPNVEWCGYLAEGVAVFARDVDGRELFGYVDVHGRILIDATYLSAYQFVNGVAQVRTESGIGFIDRLGNFIMEPLLQECSHFSDGRALVVKTDSSYLISQNGELLTLVDIDFSNAWIEEGGCGIFLIGKRTNGTEKYSYVGPSGELLCPFDLDVAHPFDDGLALVRRNNMTQYLDSCGIVIWETSSWPLRLDL